MALIKNALHFDVSLNSTCRSCVFISPSRELSGWINALEALKGHFIMVQGFSALNNLNICRAASAERTTGRSTQGDRCAVRAYQVYLQWSGWQMRRGLALIEPSPVLSASCLPEASEEWCEGEVRSREQIKGVFLTGTRGHVQGWKKKQKPCAPVRTLLRTSLTSK